MLLRGAKETPMSSVSDVGADTAIRCVVVHSSHSMYSRRENDEDGAVQE